MQTFCKVWPGLKKGHSSHLASGVEWQGSEPAFSPLAKSLLCFYALLLYTKRLSLAVCCSRKKSLYKFQNSWQIVLQFLHWCVGLSLPCNIHQLLENSRELYLGSVWSSPIFWGVFIKPANLQATSQFIDYLGSSQETKCLSKTIQNELCGFCITFNLRKVKKRAMKP